MERKEGLASLSEILSMPVVINRSVLNTANDCLNIDCRKLFTNQNNSKMHAEKRLQTLSCVPTLFR